MPPTPEPKALLPYGAEKYRDDYSEDQFWSKVRRFAKVAGKRVIESALQLYYAAEAPETPPAARGVIYGALAYFVSPIDVIPDLLPGVGYTDDLTVLLGAIAVVAAHVTPEIRDRAAQKVNEWLRD